ncbi:MAG: F0F1 ATP synthase subunit gamma, partial [Bacteroidota bacterium]|nr:F0F1 ATP synthase subunit gamma [Bacteroidota bacterium]
MATLREIRRRIASVKATSKITQAMKMVAAAKLRRAQDAMIAARPYSRALDGLLKDLLSSAGEEIAQSPVLFGRHLAEPNSEKVLLIIVSSDRGLAGAFNANIIKFAEARIREHYAEHLKTKRLSLITVGRRSTDHFTKRGYDIVDKHINVFTKLDFSTAKAIADRSSELFGNA